MYKTGIIQKMSNNQKKLVQVIAILFCMALFFVPASAETLGGDATQVNITPPYFDLPLCQPGSYPNSTLDCLPYGASESITKMQDMGIPYPIKLIPAEKPDRMLGAIPVLIARINLEEDMPAPLYESYEDAIIQANPVRYVDPGRLRYISYFDRIDYKGKAYVRMTSGEWLRAGPIAYTDFQGLAFQANPINDFGWIIDQTPGYFEPSFAAEKTGSTYIREDVVQIYQVLQAEGVNWYLINPGEWVNSIQTRRAYFAPDQVEDPGITRWISIDLQEQILYVYERGDLQFATLIASGMEPFYTQPGLFQIYQKKPIETMQGAFEADRSDFYYLEDVPWTMYYDQSRALHGSYWRTFFGYPQSHGCINLSPGDAHWLFDWANEGDWVYVYDPSGKTPTDPNLYGPGAP